VKLSVEDLQAIQQLRRTPQKRSPGRVRYQGSLAKLVRIRFVQGVGSDALNLNSEVQAKFFLSDRSFILLNGLTTVCPNYADHAWVRNVASDAPANTLPALLGAERRLGT